MTDLLIGAGAVETIQFPQIVLDEFGLAPIFANGRNQAGSSSWRPCDRPCSWGSRLEPINCRSSPSSVSWGRTT